MKRKEVHPSCPLREREEETREVLIYLGFGASLGDRLKNLQLALQRLVEKGDITVEAVSPVYESPHLGKNSEDVLEYPAHLNAVVKAYTLLTPKALLDRAEEIERLGGRIQKHSWEPRTIDIDILLYGNLQIQTHILQIPHPEIAQRAFVVVPWHDIAPELILPDGRSLKDLIQSEPIQKQRLHRFTGGLTLPKTSF